MAVRELSASTPDGTRLGQSSTDSISFLGATPASRQAATTDLKDLLVTFGLITDSGATPLNLDGGTLTAATVAPTDLTVANDITIADAGNIVLATSNGTIIGTATTQKLGFYAATPIVQRTSSAQAVIATTAAISTTSAKWGYSTSTQANAIVTLANELRAALVALGLIKGS